MPTPQLVEIQPGLFMPAHPLKSTRISIARDKSSVAFDFEVLFADGATAIVRIPVPTKLAIATMQLLQDAQQKLDLDMPDDDLVPLSSEPRKTN